MRPAPSPANARRSTQEMRAALPLAHAVPAWPCALAGILCVIIALLAMAPGVRAQGGDGLSMLFLAACGALALLSPLRRIFFPADEHDEPRARGASTFALLCALSVLFPLARTYAPLSSLALKFSWSEEPFPLSLASVLAVAGALITVGPTWRAASGIVRAALSSLLILAIFGLSSFWLLGRFYKVGPTEQVDPTPLVYLLLQSVEWAALVLLCHAASAHRKVRLWVLGAMAAALALVWARQHTLPPLPKEDE